MREIRFIFVSLLITFFLSGCAVVEKKGLIGGKGKFPDSYEPPKDLTTDELIKNIHKNNTQIKSFKADMKLVFKNTVRDKGALESSGKIAVERPHKMRLRGYSFIGGTTFDIASDGKTFWVYIPQEAKVYTGSSRFPCQRDLPAIKIRPNDILESIFFNDLITFAREKISFYEYIPGFYILYIAEKSGDNYFIRKKVWVRDDTYEIIRHQTFDQKRAIVLDVLIHELYNFGKDGYFPKKLEIIRPASHLDLAMVFSSVNIGVEFNDTIFQFQIPKNTEEINLD